MKRGKSFLILIVLMGGIMNSCNNNNPDVIYTNGNIWTGIPDTPRAEAIAVSGETILAVGTTKDLMSLKGTNTHIIDLEGKFVVPGFIDSHTHFISGGYQLSNVDLRHAKTPKDFIRIIKEFSATLPEGRWILGGNWDHENWGGELPERSWIDSVTSDIPVFVDRLDGHMGLANSAALKLAGITTETPDPPGGLIIRGKEGTPTGILKDVGISLITAVIPERSEEEQDEALERATEFALSKGVTQIHDMCTWSHLKTFQRANKRGKLKIRIKAFVWYDNWEKLIDYGKTNGWGNDWLGWKGIKAMVDGSLGSRTAWMYQPYLDDPSTTGLLVAADSSELKSLLLASDKVGIQLVIHAIGDRANDWVLDVFENIAHQNPFRERRHRIEHAQHLSSDAIPRFANLGVIASMQPYHIIDDGRWAGKRVSTDVLKTSYANKSLLDAGATLSFGSDWTVAPISPILGIYAAVTRQTLDGENPDGWYPEQKISVENALKAYTYGAAYSVFMEDKLGTLEVGKLADFVVLSADLFMVDPVNIKNVRVLRTVVNGKDRYLAD